MPSSHASSDHPGSRHSSMPPEVPRPRAPVLDAIEQEGITWEGQVLIVGHDDDIPALLFVTSERFLLTSRDTILLEAPRSWLVPSPLRVQENDVRLSITPEGVVPGDTTTERLLLTVRSGRGPAAQLVAILTGRARKEQIDAEFPAWKAGVGAGRSSSLPPLPAFETSQDISTPRPPDTADPETRGVAPIDAWKERPARTQVVPFRAPDHQPVEPQSRAARFLANRSGSVPEAESEPVSETPANVTVLDEERRKRGAGWGIWSTRIAMIAIVAIVASWFAQPYLPAEITDRLPAFVQDSSDDPDDIALNPTAVSQLSLIHI